MSAGAERNRSDIPGASPLVLIVAYEAKVHLAELISRLAQVPGIREEWCVLLLDDASTDGTDDLAKRLFAEHGFARWRVIRNGENQGYGGNQKIGYRFALESGRYSHVALLHGDCQDPPEALTDLLSKAHETGAEVVLGSRMWNVASARRGGMPLHKIIGNKLLSWSQNKLAGQDLKEYHTGMRLYSTEFLSRVPFELNSDGIDFDTEILLQAFYIEARVTEIRIPTRYADETCRVPGLRYAIRVLRASVDYWLQKHGVGCSLRFRDLQGRRALYVDKTHLSGSAHDLAVRIVMEQRARSVLDLGCGMGHIGARIRSQLSSLHYDGVDLSPNSPLSCDRYWQCDLNSSAPPVNPFEYDIVLCLDVLEHLTEPEQFLLRLRESQKGDPKTSFVFSTANVAFISIRLGLLFGHFEYGDRGILDITHRRLMTKASFKRMIRETGFVIERVMGTAVPFQLVFGDNRLTRLMSAAWRVLARACPGLFSFQTLLVARARRSIPGIQVGEVSPVPSKDAHRRPAG